jgi:hypothetical protein
MSTTRAMRAAQGSRCMQPPPALQPLQPPRGTAATSASPRPLRSRGAGALSAAPASTRQVMFDLGAAAGAANPWQGMSRGAGKLRGRPRSADAAVSAGSGRASHPDKAAASRAGVTLRLQRR